MNRRGFLHAFGTLAAAAALDPERLLWEPGKKVTFDLGTRPPMFDPAYNPDVERLYGQFTGVLRAGDVVTIAGVFEVNPVTGAEDARVEKAFVVLFDAPAGQPVQLYPNLHRLSGTHTVKPFGAWT